MEKEYIEKLIKLKRDVDKFLHDTEGDKNSSIIWPIDLNKDECDTYEKKIRILKEITKEKFIPKFIEYRTNLDVILEQLLHVLDTKREEILIKERELLEKRKEIKQKFTDGRKLILKLKLDCGKARRQIEGYMDENPGEFDLGGSFKEDITLKPRCRKKMAIPTKRLGGSSVCVHSVNTSHAHRIFGQGE
ncbi:hypothetical protein ADUPG1_007249 [Aduncisulcus paluster]|uniref:Uncharacterized protein n=1 Tax=Aduncisulcus paluster TaxID=2918883 RepID=A0ABQ5KLB3_9EUKA|nr:hypothetical protein ADUPG1_007249 [Aduncisulcus paluster]